MALPTPAALGELMSRLRSVGWAVAAITCWAGIGTASAQYSVPRSVFDAGGVSRATPRTSPTNSLSDVIGEPSPLTVMTGSHTLIGGYHPGGDDEFAPTVTLNPIPSPTNYAVGQALTWSAHDTTYLAPSGWELGSGVAKFTMEFATDSTNGPWTPWFDGPPDGAAGSTTATFPTSPAAPGVLLPFTMDDSWVFRLRAVDSMGNVSEWSYKRLTIAPLTVVRNEFDWVSDSVKVDGIRYDAPVTLALPRNSSHLVVGLSPQMIGPDEQYVYRGWSDAGAQTHSISISGPAILTMLMTHEFKLTVAKAPGDTCGDITIGANTFTRASSASAWVAENTSVSVSVTEFDYCATDDPTTMRQWTSWSDAAALTHTTSPIVAPTTLTASYLTYAPMTVCVSLVTPRVDSLTWRWLNRLYSSSTVTPDSDRVQVVNCGNAPLGLGLNMQATADAIPWAPSGGPGPDQYALRARLDGNATAPAMGAFTANDVVIGALRNGDDGIKFGGFLTILPPNPNVPGRIDRRSLWVRLDYPTASAAADQHFDLRLSARTTLP